MGVTQPTLRPAIPGELPALQALLLRSKASWGYDPSFLEALRDELVLRLDYLERTEVWVYDAEGVQGFYGLRYDHGTAELVDLFVAPEAMGHGYGRALFEHAVERARAQGCRTMQWESDPHAEPFYVHMGAHRIGIRDSQLMAGRQLPLMALKL